MAPSDIRMLVVTVLAVAVLGMTGQLVESLNNTLYYNNPFHASWKEKQTKFDFIFSLDEAIKADFKLESPINNTSADFLKPCHGYSACLLRDGGVLEKYRKSDSQDLLRSLYKSVPPNSNQTVDSQITISHYCTTHWDQPTHSAHHKNNHFFVWHSPYSCPETTRSNERPCYIYDSSGGLIDLTPLILSNGTAHKVDPGPYDFIKNFDLNICNEARQSCGTSVSSCYENYKNATPTKFVSGYNNLTNLEYKPEDKTVLLTTFGQNDQSCPDGRLKTVVKFRCSTLPSDVGPKLRQLTSCDSVVDWPTVHACPVVEVAPFDCTAEHEHGFRVRLKDITKNQTFVEVPNIQLDGKSKTAVIGICQGISKDIITCEGKSTSQTTSCLMDENVIAKHANANNSEIIGKIDTAKLSYVGNRVYLESYVAKKTCQVPREGNFSSSNETQWSATQQVGTRIEFFCSSTNFDKPVYLDRQECVYIFEWGSQLLCSESLDKNIELSGKYVENSTNTTLPTNSSQSSRQSEVKSKIDHSEASKNASQLHKDSVKDASATIKTTVDQSMKNDTKVPPVPDSRVVDNQTATSSVNEPQKFNRSHKFFMISLIVMSLGAFFVVIFILDKKTRLRIPLGNIRRQARQVFQPQPVPYSRVNDFNYSLDL